ncbi:MAG: sigma-70 family RNA polymerase sigma factor [Kiritimatiellae bacterium]|nr:sigma-70 family RNA polymerase sigma factor [Kiritimatiellia bacterium]
MQLVEHDKAVALLEEVKTGNTSAVERLLPLLDPIVCWITTWRKWRFDHATQKDVQQNIRIELCRKFESVDNPGKIASFVKRVCVRRCIDELRRIVRRGGIFTEIAEERDLGEEGGIRQASGARVDPVGIVMWEEEARDVMEKIESLGELCKEVILAIHLEGLKYREAAARLGISTNTVGTRLYGCMERLRRLL